MRYSVICLLLLVASRGLLAQDGSRWRPARAVVRSPVRRSSAEKPNHAPKRLTLEQLEQWALTQSPSLTISSARIAAARGRRRQAGLYPNPVIGYMGMEMGNQNTPGKQGGYVRQRIITGNKLKLDMAIAGHSVDEREWLYAADRKQLVHEVRVLFYETLIAQQRVALAAELVRLGDGLVEATRKLVGGRQATPNALLQAEIQAEEAKILSDNARNRQRESWRRLASLIGDPALGLTSLHGDATRDLPRYTWDECRSLVLERHPELAAAQVRVGRSRLAVTRARREVIPDVDINVRVGHVFPTNSDVAEVILGVPLPVFDRNQGNISRAEAELTLARHDVRRIELDLYSRLATVYREYANARQQARRYSERILPNARKSLDLVINGYRQGQVPFIVQLTMQRKYVEVNLAYLESIRQLRESVTVIESQLLATGLHGHRRKTR